MKQQYYQIVIQVKNGVLYFETPEVYLSTFNKLSNLTDEDLIKWETSLGFTSLRTIISNEYLKIEALSEQKDVKNLLDENSYLQLITNSQNELEIVEPISREFQNICNKDFIFVVSNQIYKIEGNICFIFRSNDIKKVLNEDISNINENIVTDEYIAFKTCDKTVKEINYKAGNYVQLYANSLAASAYQKDDNDTRRCYIEFGVSTPIGIDWTYTKYVYYRGVAVEITPKKKILGIWTKYKTNITVNSVSVYSNIPNLYLSFSNLISYDKDSWYQNLNIGPFYTPYTGSVSDYPYNTTLQGYSEQVKTTGVPTFLTGLTL